MKPTRQKWSCDTHTHTHTHTQSERLLKLWSWELWFNITVKLLHVLWLVSFLLCFLCLQAWGESLHVLSCYFQQNSHMPIIYMWVFLMFVLGTFLFVCPQIFNTQQITADHLLFLLKYVEGASWKNNFLAIILPIIFLFFYFLIFVLLLFYFSHYISHHPLSGVNRKQSVRCVFVPGWH